MDIGAALWMREARKLRNKAAHLAHKAMYAVGGTKHKPIIAGKTHDLAANIKHVEAINARVSDK